MVDSAALRQRRKRGHRQGNHTLCRAEHCRLAGTIERDDVRELRDAIEVGFAGDPERLAVARRNVELASGTGPTAAAALRELDRMIEAKRSGRAAASIPPEGPFTASDATFDLARWVTDAMLVERLDELGELVAEEGFVPAGFVSAAEEWTRRMMADLDADVARHKRAGWGNYAAGLVSVARDG